MQSLYRTSTMYVSEDELPAQVKRYNEIGYDVRSITDLKDGRYKIDAVESTKRAARRILLDS